jgi:hypothetical protein
MLMVLMVSLSSSSALAQSGPIARWDLLVGFPAHQYLYQWPHLGGTGSAPAATCSVQPNEVIVGEPVTASVKTDRFNPKHKLSYVWNPIDRGGKIIGTEAVAQIETTDAAPGNYTVSAHVTDDKAKKNNEASCTADFIVKPVPPKNPPTLSSVSASPMSVAAGGTVSLSANCTSPDGVPVTISWASVGGSGKRYLQRLAWAEGSGFDRGYGGESASGSSSGSGTAKCGDQSGGGSPRAEEHLLRDLDAPSQRSQCRAG